VNSKPLSVVLARIFAVTVTMLVLASSTQAANKFKILHRFLDSPAAEPLGGLVADSAGNFYGTTRDSSATTCGSSFGCGTVFMLTSGPDGKWTYHVIHRFKGPDGEVPTGGLIIDAVGNLYGTTEAGGPHKKGTVFELSPSGKRWTHRILYGFGAQGDVANPYGTLTVDTSGNLYGAASAGPSGWGGVFELKPSGNQWQETVLHVFQNGSDGAFPEGNMVLDSAGNLYGTTLEGGNPGLGVVFQLAPAPNGNWRETILYTFYGQSDGAYPVGGLTADIGGNLYGAASGGPGCRQFGCGTIFTLSPSMNTWSFRVLYSFRGPDGMSPGGPLTLDSAGSLFGAALYGGQYSYGVVFELAHHAGDWAETVLHSFNLMDGAYPSGGLVFDQAGVIYSTSEGGGINRSACSLENGCGVVFSISP
jgi:uncharacterized repeat protein (TIGR03803 family)